MPFFLVMEISHPSIFLDMEIKCPNIFPDVDFSHPQGGILVSQTLPGRGF